MNITKLLVGKLVANCYILENHNEVLIIDPGDEEARIISCIGLRKVVGIVITHHHFDHDGCAVSLKEYYKTSIYDYYNLDKDVTIGNFQFKVIKTPGHSLDSITLYFPKEMMMFVGDFIFKGSVGRCDFKGGSWEDMKISINMIKQYNPGIRIFPGHGESTTIDDEINNNPYFRL